jgi:hypothetical protein
MNRRVCGEKIYAHILVYVNLCPGSGRLEQKPMIDETEFWLNKRLGTFGLTNRWLTIGFSPFRGDSLA